MAQDTHASATAAAATAEARNGCEDAAVEDIDRLRQELESRIARARRLGDADRPPP
jgi:hypothetical protein